MSKPAAYRGSDPHAFVAYSHADEKRIHDELKWLNNQGFNTYYDDGIHPGHRWREEIATAIDAATVVVFFITPRSVSSEDCLRELNYALDQYKPVLAVHLEQTELPSGVKLSINDRQAILSYAMSPTDYRLRLQEALGEYLPTEPSAAVVEQAAESDKRRLRWQLIYLPVPLLLATLALLVALGVWWDPFDSRKEDATSGLSRAEALELLSEAEDLVNGDRYGEAFYLMREIGGVLGDYPELERLRDEILIPAQPRVRERGANVFFRPRQLDVETEWIEVGATPLTEFPAPQGVLELRIEKEGYRTGHFLVANPGPLLDSQDPRVGEGPFPEIELTPLSSPGAVQIPASNLALILQGSPQGPEGGSPIALPAFLIGEREVTNRDFKAFVDARGYENAQYWQGLTFPDDRPFDLETHRSDLTDTTGRNAPSGWELGNFPSGTGEHPVGGVSWFEAMAYARFKGQTLPTIHHWTRAAPRARRKRLTLPCTWLPASATSMPTDQGPPHPTHSVPGEPSTWPATCGSGSRTPPARADLPWAAPGMTTNPTTFIPTPSVRWIGSRTMASEP